MAQPASLQRTLQQLDALLARRQVFECHRPNNLGHGTVRTTQFKQAGAAGTGHLGTAPAIPERRVALGLKAIDFLAVVAAGKP